MLEIGEDSTRGFKAFGISELKDLTIPLSFATLRVCFAL